MFYRLKWTTLFSTYQQRNDVTSDHSVNEHWHFNSNLTSIHRYIIDDIDELHDEFLMIDDELGRNCPIRGDLGKTLKFAEVAQICEFCEFRDAREKFTALNITVC